jgi:ABC-type transport system involved in multi-copper enzyme maturation permease subunit
MLAKAKNSFSEPWPLWRRQILAIWRLEIGRNLFAPIGLWVFFLAFAPAVIAGAHSVREALRPGACSFAHDTEILALIFQLFYLRLAFFFGCLGIFVRLFRGEMVDRTLHYHLLAPLRREVLVVGKFLAGSLGSATVFVAGGATTFTLMYAHHGSDATAFLLHEQGLLHLGAYLGVTVLGCLGYGAVFLALSLIFKNPVLAAVVFLGWESIAGMLPAALQYLSVAFYLKPLFPVEAPVVGFSGLFTVVVEPIPVWLAVVCLLLYSLAVVTVAAVRIRYVEIDQGTD